MLLQNSVISLIFLEYQSLGVNKQGKRALKRAIKRLKLINRDISSSYFFLFVDLRERGTLLQQTTQPTHLFFNTNFKCTSVLVIFEENWFVLTYFTRHYFTGQIILKIILTIQYMEIYYSLANNNVNCIGFYWYKFNKLRKCYEMLKNILYFLRLTFFQSVFLLQKGTSFS